MSVEDSVTGVTAGKAAGLTVIGFTAADHCGPNDGDLLRAAGADHIATTAAEFAAHLLPSP